VVKQLLKSKKQNHLHFPAITIKPRQFAVLSFAVNQLPKSQLGLSHTIIQENQDVERWNNKTTQTQSLYLIGPGGRSYASIETYTKNGRTYNSNLFKRVETADTTITTD
jgi:hypothetical protein